MKKHWFDPKKKKNDVSLSSDDECKIEMAVTSTPVYRDKSYMPPYESCVSREEFNKVMMDVGADNEGLSPMNYQICSHLETVSIHAKKAIKRKYNQAMYAFPNYCPRPIALVRI